MIDDILNVHKPARSQFPRDARRAFDELLHDGAGQVPRRIGGDAVARVDAGPLNVFHDSGNQHVPAVTDCVNFNLSAFKVFVDQHGALAAQRQNAVHVIGDALVVVCNDHVLPAQHIGRTQQHRIADVMRGIQGFFQRGDAVSPGTGNAAAVQDFVELLAVFGGVNGGSACAEYCDAVLVECFRQLDGCLAAEGHNHAKRFFNSDDVKHIFRRERLEVQAVGRVEIGAHRFGIVVDHHNRIALPFQRPDTVHGRVVKLNALADADRPAADHYNGAAAFSAFLRFGNKLCCFIDAAGAGRRRGIEIRGLCCKFRRAGIDHAVNRRLMFLYRAA